MKENFPAFVEDFCRRFERHAIDAKNLVNQIKGKTVINGRTLTRAEQVKMTVAMVEMERCSATVPSLVSLLRQYNQMLENINVILAGNDQRREEDGE